MSLAPSRREAPPRRRTRAEAEAEAAIAQGEAQLARYMGRLDRLRAGGRDTSGAEVLVRAAAARIALAGGGLFREDD